MDGYDVVRQRVAASTYRDGPGLDVCPPVQECLDGPEVASLSSPVESSPSILSETQMDNNMLHRYIKFNQYTYLRT